MPTLREVQRALARGIFSADPEEALAHVAGDAIAAAERFAVHRNNAVTTLVGALCRVYPVVEKLVGAEFFAAAARAFIDRHPPRTAYLNHYGAEFADFLGAFPAAAEIVYLSDVARFEWAVHGVLNAPDAPALAPAMLVELSESAHGEVRFVPHPAVRLLTVNYPADAIWRAVQAGDDAALAALELDGAPMSFLVERRGDAVALRRLTADEAQMTALLFSGAALSQVAPEHDRVAFVTLLAEHLAQGRFAGFAAPPQGRGDKES
ncbi:MAG: putative DNA-binding domain-containing protein [Hyphomicrobiales bacterium]|nr:putative DNA-binding domain-containing protein [Hyphomicrobiales bacterium]MBV8824919.1 putative DNA-binding domain-containing protein [Hyphomicrobiales bacterium]MBV9429594.1 putative DNA-binding domain-containing protein [Bradyrhizobiaceae bacterium]